MPDVLLQDVPDEILRAVNETAERDSISVSDVFAEAIASRFGIKLPPESRRRFAGGASGPHVTIDLPADVRTALRVEAASNGKTIRGIALNTVARRFKLAAVSEGRRSRG